MSPERRPLQHSTRSLPLSRGSRSRSAAGAFHGERRAASESNSPADQLLVAAAFGIQLEAPQQAAIGAQGHRHVGVFVGVDADNHFGAGAALGDSISGPPVATTPKPIDVGGAVCWMRITSWRELKREQGNPA